MSFVEQIEQLTGRSVEKVGIVVVDHGSRREQSNLLLNDVVAMLQRISKAPIVEPAHMELAEPSIAAAFAACVDRGAELVVVFPYFLSPGRHWSEDIPRLAAEAAASHPEIRHLVTQPLGLHEAMAEIFADRVTHCLAHAIQGGPTCALCQGTDGCQL